MAEASLREDEVPVVPGKVGRARQEWSVREDGVYAYRLQNEEISRHYEGNRNNHHLHKSDYHQAKHLQEHEYNEMIAKFERELAEQLEEDERIALQLQEEEEMRNRQHHHQALQSDNVERDRLLALKLQAKEKQKVLRRRIAKEKREVDRIRSLNAQETLDIDSNALDISNPLRAAASADIDLSEFCMKPPPGLTERELQDFLAEQDAELARFLQQQEAMKDALKDKLTVIESQDHEIAMVLQEQERAKARRLKEKARMKAAQRNGSEAGAQHGDTMSQTHSAEYEDLGSEIGHSSRNGGGDNSSHILDSNGGPHANFHNVAMDLDPTYNKPVEYITTENGLHFARLCRVSPNESDQEDISPQSTMLPQEHNQSLESGAYLPVQGHRRTSQEKTNKKKKSKDGCKTQ